MAGCSAKLRHFRPGATRKGTGSPEKNPKGRKASRKYDYQDGIFSGTNNVVEKLTGRKPLTFEQFVEINRDRFAK
jgi:hypothetical protein